MPNPEADHRRLLSPEPRVNALEDRTASLPTDVTAQITVEQNECLASARDLNTVVPIQGAKLDGAIGARQRTETRKRHQLAITINDSFELTLSSAATSMWKSLSNLY